jgi:superfamily II DNA or RNA helicase
MSRFKGRNDVFARRWQKWDGSISGYAPVYTDSKKIMLEPFTAAWAEKHLLGNAVLGVYPLLGDNTSHFIAADFDGDGWKKSVRTFYGTCRKYNVPVAIERSRSGNGAHAWLFFSEPYPAYKSRRIFTSLLREADVIGEFEKNETFDRLFPNQDYLSGKGLGNLIAMPLQGATRKSGNSVFVDVENDFKIVDDQWTFLKDVRLMTPVEMDTLYETLNRPEDIAFGRKANRKSRKDKRIIDLVVSSTIHIRKNELIPSLVSYLREELNLLNIEYIVKERAGLPTYGSPRFIKTIETDEESVLIPRGFLAELRQWLDKHEIHYSITDKRHMADLVRFAVKTELYPYQDKALRAFTKIDQGVMVAPAGSGKTIMGLGLISQKKQPAIILTHRRQIYDQWLERIEHTLGIPKTKIGQICSVKKKDALPITVAMVQTLARAKDWNRIAEKFGTVIVDECHHMPAKMFRSVVSRFNSKYLFGLTATPDRKYNDQKLISAYLGPIIHTVEKEEIIGRNPVKNSSSADTVVVRVADTEIPFATTPRHFPLISKIISNDSRRNALIVSDIINEASKGKKCLVLTERKEHAEMLQAYVRKDFETLIFSGDLSARQRKFALQKIKGGRFAVLIATGQILGEGTDIENLDTLFLTFPVSFHGKLAQYIGRIRRDGGTKKIYDYRDVKVPILEKMWKKRAAYYRKNDLFIEESPHQKESLLSPHQG